MKSILLLIWTLLSVSHTYAQTFSSTDKQTHLIELYTSEGCSSCPPADRWLSELEYESGLWTDFVPVAFHVDYWDYIGWKDRFADKRFNDRQFRYANSENLSSVYTPGILIDGNEWRRRPWSSLPEANEKGPGQLTVNLHNSNLSASFDTSLSKSQTVLLNVAVLGFDQQSKINAGENKGDHLEHNFVVLQYKKLAMQPSATGFKLEPIPFSLQTLQSQRLAIASWISQIKDQTPIQATGGWLK